MYVLICTCTHVSMVVRMYTWFTPPTQIWFRKGFLFGMEGRWRLQKYNERRMDILSRFKRVSRYIDDLKAFNSRGAIGEFKSEIYGPLELSRGAGEDGSGAHFLDMDLHISGGMVHVGLYDKRDSFGFRVASFPTLPSNVDKKQAHASLIGQLLRFGRILLWSHLHFELKS